MEQSEAWSFVPLLVSVSFTGFTQYKPGCLICTIVSTYNVIVNTSKRNRFFFYMEKNVLFL